MKVALISEVYPGPEHVARLHEHLAHAKSQGAELVVLPELPLQRWVPGTRDVREDDAEPVGGPRQRALADAAKHTGVAVVGGAIVRVGDHRLNQAFVFDAQGAERGRYSKLHVPQEPGFWEADHYAAGPGDLPLMAVNAVPLGIQICSDINRPQGTHVLAARGARLVCHPRATEPGTIDDWRLVLRATARTAAVWIASVNRPRPEDGVPLGGPSIVVDPSGVVVVQREETFTFFELDPARNDEAIAGYPGYLAVRSDVYATAWSETLPRDRQDHLGRGTDSDA